jgi:hypothetical protein
MPCSMSKNTVSRTLPLILTEFQQLLDRLEGSKKRQVRQKSVEDRRGTFAQGLAGMMSNF